MEFRVIKESDKELFSKYIINNPCSSYNFITCYAWCNEDNLKICEQDGFLYIMWEGANKARMLFPKGNGNLKDAINSCVKYLKSRNLKPYFAALSEDDVIKMKDLFGDEFYFDYDRNNSDYIYECEKLINLSGKKLHSNKNNYNSFVKKYNFTYRELTDADKTACKRLFDNWYTLKDENARLLKQSRAATYKIIDNVGKFGLKGAVIEIDGEIAACSVGEEISPDTVLIHLEFANRDYNGIYAAINKMFAQNEWKDYKYINREEDMGDLGLRRAKESYQPYKLLNEYTAKLK